jgi:cytochrome c-type biogenesis protein CcmH/NrfF
MPNTSTNDNHQQKIGSTDSEISDEMRKLIEEKTSLGWDANKILNFMVFYYLNYSNDFIIFRWHNG